MEVKLTHHQPDACDTCKELAGSVIDTDYPATPVHPNCKCECEPIEEDEANNEAANGQDGQAIEANEPDPITAKAAAIDNDEPIDVQVSIVGKLVGSDKEGNPKPQTIDEQSLKAIADNLNAESKEVLVDVDHQSTKDGLERNTKAAGWLSQFWTTAKGLFAKMKLTPFGKDLVKGREYRKLSPVFTLDKNRKPTGLLSVAMTNTPAMQDIQPILNQNPNQEIIKMTEMTKEELVQLIKETIAENACSKKDETVNEAPPATPPTDTPPPDAPDTPAEPADTTPETDPVETTEEAKIDKVENEAVETETEIVEQPVEEVIKEESLNQAPTMAMPTDAPWKNLHGEAFFKWCRENGH